MSEQDYIIGYGGGGKGGGGGGGQEDQNTLFSTAKGRVIDLLSEGEIGGLLNGKKSIYLEGTPLQDASGTDNFEGVSWATRVGTNTQDYIPGFSGTENSTTLNTEVKNGSPGPVVTSFTSSIVDAVRVGIWVPALTNADNDRGDIHGSSVSFKIELDKDSSGTWTTVFNGSISGKCTQRFDKSYRFDIPSSWTSFSNISIRVTRISGDETSAKIVNTLYFGSYTIIVDNKLTYPNSALVAMQFNAEQFSSIPTRGYEVKGVKVRVPSNYTAYDPGHCSLGGYRRKDSCVAAGSNWTGTAVGTTLYSGSWDGTFTTAWTCNPAWILYDLCTEERYGLGRWLTASQLDKWALYEIARYCDAVNSSGNFVGVDDGWGNKEARFTCNLYLQSAEEAFKILNDIAAIFRGLIYWQEGMITPVQDTPKDPVMNFSEANVIQGNFTYEGVSRKQRHNVAQVTWNNPEDLYKKNVEYVEDAEAIALNNNQIFSKSIRALGCTSQSQARRVGKWLLYTERYETEICSFKTGLEANGVKPGDLIKVADPGRAGVRYGGRVSPGSSTTLIKLDSSTPVITGKTYKISLVNTESACVRDGSKQTITSTTNSSGAAAGKLKDSTASFDSSFLGITITDAASNTATVTVVDSATELTLDSDILSNSENYTYYIPNQSLCLNTHGDNEWKPYTWVEQKTVNTVSTTESVTEVGVTAAFTNTPTSNFMWILEEIGTVEAQDFRILSIRESEANIYEVSALKYHEAKYDLIESNISFSAKSTSSLPNPSEAVPLPRSLDVDEELYTDSRNVVRNRATLSWKAPYTAGTSVLYPYTASYYVEWRRTAPITNWTSLGETTSTSMVIDDAPAGEIEFRVKTRRVY